MKAWTWAVELLVREIDVQLWLERLREPHDPFIEYHEDHRGPFLALRASVFNDFADSISVHEEAKRLCRSMNVGMALIEGLSPAEQGPVIEFRPEGPPRKYHFKTIEIGVSVRSSTGTAPAPSTAKAALVPPSPSLLQKWMRAASVDSRISHALDYLHENSGWHGLYKAYEALQRLPNGGIARGDITLFTHTANTGNRHHTKAKDKPPAAPMSELEARELITRWVSAAADHIVANNQLESCGQ